MNIHTYLLHGTILINKLQTRLASFKIQKKGLMQQLLTGKVSV